MKPIQRMSLSGRLMATLIGASLAYWAIVVVVMINDSVNEAYELFDTHLAQTAIALLRVDDPDDAEPPGMPGYAETPGGAEMASGWPHLALHGPPPEEGGPDAPMDLGHSMYAKYGRDFEYQIWSHDGKLLLHSADAPITLLTERDGFSETSDGKGRNWRTYSVWNPQGSVRVVVAEALDRRTSLLHGIALNLVKPLVLGLPVLLLLLWYSIRRGLSPLRALTQEISRRRVDSLTPVDPGSSPDEIRPMILALNKLLKRVEDAVEHERSFTANAAHELRTPLAAIQAHLAAARAAGRPEERERSLDNVQRSLERSVRLVDQLLTLARLDPEQTAPHTGALDVGSLLESICAELAPLALQRDQLMELYVEPKLPEISGNAGMLGMLFTNLIDNAIRYTGGGGDVSIDAYRDGDTEVCIEVSDDGPGIPAADRARVFERFTRLEDQSKPGTGLGLAICRRVVELHGARIDLADGRDGRGLSVLVRFPVAPAQALQTPGE
jgi:two-component system sensor histidine kinase QseC